MAMVEKIFPDLFRIELPLPNNPLKAVNCYLVAGQDRWLLVDTGMNRRACKVTMNQALKSLNVDLGRTDFFITHIHADHAGQVLVLAEKNSKIYIGRKESGFAFTDALWNQACRLARAHGFDAETLQEIQQTHPNRKFGFKGDTQVRFSQVSDGDAIRVGDYHFACIETPGHSPGHMCLYDDKKGLLISGDHILPEITSYIGALGMLRTDNPLSAYFASLEKTVPLDVALVLPGHRAPFKGHRERIRQLIAHHRQRLEDIVEILDRENRLNAWEVAARMRWDYNGPWDSFPAKQKWFATSEALTHLVFLLGKGTVKEEKCGQTLVFVR
jgi:glyoxylase-like metal-dependent hydrolase (beta-lactamase superfamily II)